jgi:hypothetical protein
MHSKYYLVFLILLFCGSVSSQENVDSLIYWSNKLLNDTSENERIISFNQTTSKIKSILNDDTNIVYDFSKVKSISSLESEDKKCKVFTYNLRFKDETYLYGGIIQYYNSNKNHFEVVELIDKSATITKPNSQILNANNWFGALYYKLWVVKYKKQKYYMLLGWDGNTAFSNKKLIDLFYFNSKGEIQFGAPIIEFNKKRQSRVIFEHAERVSMSLKYQEKSNKIIFDHLAPSQPSLEGQFEFYCPDFTTDALEFKKGKWNLIINYEARNDKEKK